MRAAKNEPALPPGLSNVVAVAAGGEHSLAIRADGTVAAWGSNNCGQTNVPPGLGNVVAVAAGGSHSLAARADGTVVAWGNDDYGLRTVPPGSSNVVAVAAGYSHSVALREDGTVVAWGNQEHGVTIVPSGLTNVVAVSAGQCHSLAVRADGTVAVWGYDGHGEPSVPPGLSNVVAATASGYSSLAVCANGTVVIWGEGGCRTFAPGAAPELVGQLASAAVGAWRCLAAADAGRPFLIPMVRHLQAPLGVPIFLRAQPVGQLPIACQWEKDGAPLDGATDALLILTATSEKQSGDYRCIASNVQGVTTGAPVHVTFVPISVSMPPQSGAAFIGQAWPFTVEASGASPLKYEWMKDGQAIGAATSSTYVLPSAQWTDAGSYSVTVRSRYGDATTPTAQFRVRNVAAWGSNERSATAVPAELSELKAVAAGGSYCLGVRADGSVVAWGSLWDGRDFVAAAAPAGLTNVVGVAAGYSHCLAERADGAVLAWGRNDSGQANVPPALTNAVAVAAGWEHSLALRADGTVLAWGRNDSGQAEVPAGLNDVVAVAAGWAHNLAVRTDGSVSTWGADEYGQASVPPGLSNVVGVAAGGWHSLALCADGSVVAWGSDDSGQATVPAGLSNVVAVAAGGNHSLAIRADGSIVAWGTNSAGQAAAVPPGLRNVTAAAAGMQHSVAVICARGPFPAQRAKPPLKARNPVRMTPPAQAAAAPEPNFGDRYDTARDLAADLELAKQVARRENKRILLKLGNTSCGWCWKLNAFTKEHKDIDALLKKHYVVVYMNVPVKPEHADLYKLYPTTEGTPFLWVLDAEAKGLKAQGVTPFGKIAVLLIGKEYRRVQSYHEDLLREFLDQWKPEPRAAARPDGSVTNAVSLP
jgi:alpha-tubulin suppressor-like RCC1 family protein